MRGVSPDTLLSGKCHHMKAKQTRSRRQAEAGKNKRLFFFHFRGLFCFDLVKNQAFRLYVIKYCLILFLRTFRKRDKRDNWLEKEAWKPFFGRKYFLIPAAILRNREAQYIQFLPKQSWLSSVMPSQLKMNLVCIAKAAKIELKKKWIGKINKITKKPSRGSFVKQTVGTVYLT